ncbi:MAG TPA: hypothetical protein VJG83_01605 [archaeon]|nr:hypothetical protein [archaeon]
MKRVPKVLHNKRVVRWMKGKGNNLSWKMANASDQKLLISEVEKSILRPPHIAPLGELMFLSNYAEGTLKTLITHTRRTLIRKGLIPEETHFRGGPRFSLAGMQTIMVRTECDRALKNGGKLDVLKILNRIRPPKKMWNSARATVVQEVIKFNRGRPKSDRVYPVTAPAGGILK